MDFVSALCVPVNTRYFDGNWPMHQLMNSIRLFRLNNTYKPIVSVLCVPLYIWFEHVPIIHIYKRTGEHGIWTNLCATISPQNIERACSSFLLRSYIVCSIQTIVSILFHPGKCCVLFYLRRKSWIRIWNAAGCLNA